MDIRKVVRYLNCTSCGGEAVHTPRKFGAPPKREAEPGERFQLGVRVTAELKRKLDAAAEESGRSQSQEAELRLEHTFDRQGLLPEVLTLAYGSEQIAGMVMMVGAVLAETHRFLRNVVVKDEDGNYSELGSHALDQAIKAAQHVLEAIRPVDAPDDSVADAEQWADIMIRGIRGDRRETVFSQSARTIRPMLGKIADTAATRKKVRQQAQQGKQGHGSRQHHTPREE
jgi:hypothetical protein